MNNFYFCVDSPSDALNANNFKFELPSTLQLEGSWTVALCELSYVNKFSNVKSDENMIRVSVPWDGSGAGGVDEISRNEVLSVPMGTTRNIQDLVRTIQTHVRAYDTNAYIRLVINATTGKFEYRLPRLWSINIRKGSLCQLLVFGDAPEDGIHLMDRGVAPYPIELYGGWETFHVKCDFVEPNSWINTCRKSILAANLSLELADVGIHIRRRCEQLMYVPVNRQRLQTLTFTLENSRGDVIDIANRSHFLLHFKKQNILPFLRNV